MIKKVKKWFFDTHTVICDTSLSSPIFVYYKSGFFLAWIFAHLWVDAFTSGKVTIIPGDLKFNER